MPPPSLKVLYEDNHLLVLNKPAGLATMGAAAGTRTLLAMAKDYVKARYHKPGNVYLGVVSRLDAPVSGAVVFARTSKAARRLSEQFRGREVEKLYWAVVDRQIEPVEADLNQWIVRDEAAGRMRIVDPQALGAQQAQLHYRRLRLIRGDSLLEVDLQTGRKHQIRAQLADRGHPILGDRKYGSRRSFAAGIALHARRLKLIHPVRREEVEFVAPLPRAWRELGVDEP